MKALLLQQLPDGKIVVIETNAYHEIRPSALVAIQPKPESHQYPHSDNVFGVICDYFKPEPT